MPDPETLDPVGEYAELVGRVLQLADACLPVRARVAVVSKGDDRLLALRGRTCAHFPAGPDGGYSGFHPRDGAAAVALLEEARARGMDHLVIPATALWWLDYYGELREHLASSAREVVRDDAVGAVFQLTGYAREDETDGAPPALEPAAAQLRALIDALLPPGAGVALAGPPELRVALSGRPNWLLRPSRAGADALSGERPTPPEIERGRRAGARYLVVAAGEGHAHVAQAATGVHPLVTHQPAVGSVFDLGRSHTTPPSDAPVQPSAVSEKDMRRVARGLLPRDASVLIVPAGSTLPTTARPDFAVLVDAGDGDPTPWADDPDVDAECVWRGAGCVVYRRWSNPPRSERPTLTRSRRT